MIYRLRFNRFIICARFKLIVNIYYVIVPNEMTKKKAHLIIASEEREKHIQSPWNILSLLNEKSKKKKNVDVTMSVDL